MEPNHALSQTKYSCLHTARVRRAIIVSLPFLVLGCASILWMRDSHAAGPPLQQARQSSDGLWRDLEESAIARPGQQRTLIPQFYRTLSLDKDAFTKLVSQVQMEFTQAATANPVVMSLPMPDGTFARFRVVESPIMDPALAAQFPEIKTYQGQGIDDPTATSRFDWTPAGFHGQVLSAEKAVYIDPYAKGDTTNYISYYKRDIQKEAAPFRCYVTETTPLTKLGGPGAPSVSNSGTLRSYRLALAATGEYTDNFRQAGDTDAQAQARALLAMITTMNRVNGIYEREVAVRMILIANETAIIYTDATTDPYTAPPGSGTINSQNQTNLDAVIGDANYDIGHVIGISSGGLASLAVVCASGAKASASTGRPTPSGDAFDVDYVAHEMGHQFGGSHTFNNGTDGSCGGGTRTGSAAYEPGSGSTIMAYAGICAPANLQPNSDDYFHVKSLEQIVAFITGGGGSVCAATTATGNNVPVVSAGPDYTIPTSTPFVLTAAGFDPDGDALTYCWEEYDLGSASPPEGDNGSRPIFRSFDPVTSPARTFPKLADILSNTSSFGESLPTTNRTMTFQVTARDNRAGGAAINTSTMQATVTTSSGPFLVTAPNTAVVWQVGSTQTVSWNVANTTAAPVSCANVKVSLSTDGGSTFPIVLAASTANDGSESVTVPSASGTTSRVKVEAVGNIFFDISNTNFTINLPPVIACPADITTNTDPGLCSAGVTFTATASDDMPGVVVACAPPSGSTFPKGTTTVNCTATDSVGATDTCSFTVTVNDTEPPAITCPANIIQSTDPGLCSAVVTYSSATATDNCPGVGAPVCNPPSGSTFPKGATVVTCVVSDAAGNSGTCVFTITVNDTQPPSITCPPNQTAVTDQNACPSPACQTVDYPAPTAADNCPGVDTVCNPPAGTCFPVGVTTVTCTATDASGNTASCSFTVTTFDTALQDDSNPSTILLWNSITGAYRFCCNGVTYTGVGKATRQACVYTLQHNPADRRVLGRVDKAVHSGTGSIQAPAGTARCTIFDRSTLVDTLLPSCQ